MLPKHQRTICLNIWTVHSKSKINILLVTMPWIMGKLGLFFRLKKYGWSSNRVKLLWSFSPAENVNKYKDISLWRFSEEWNNTKTFQSASNLSAVQTWCSVRLGILHLLISNRLLRSPKTPPKNEVNKLQMMSCPWSSWSAVVSDCYHGNTSLSSALACGVRVAN